MVGKVRPHRFIDLDQPNLERLLSASCSDTFLQFGVYRVGIYKTEMDMDYNKYHGSRSGTYTPTHSMARGGTGSQNREAIDAWRAFDSDRLQRVQEQQRQQNDRRFVNPDVPPSHRGPDTRIYDEFLDPSFDPRRNEPRNIPCSLTGGGNPSKPSVLCSVSTNRRIQLTIA